MNPYEYLFYRLYKQMRKTYRAKSSTIFVSLWLGPVFFLNLYTIDAFLKKQFHTYDIISSPNIAISCGLLLAGLNCIYFLRNDKYLKIEERYANETKQHRGWGMFGILCYLITSLIIFLYVGSL